jgi:hypothetical protein
MQESVATTEGTRTGESLAGELREYHGQLEAVNEDVRHLVVGLTEAQFNWRAVPGQWSIAECLNHLAVTNHAMTKPIKEAIVAARAKGLTSNGPFRHGFIGNMLIRSMEPPPRRKFKAPKIFKPVPDKSFDDVTGDFFAAQDEALGLIREAKGIDLGRVKITSPVTRLIKYSLGQAFRLIATHDRRHLWQARQVKENPSFPKT